jgi:hypothetical protein
MHGKGKMKFLYKILLFNLLVLCSPLWSQTGKIAGYVYNGSQDSLIIPNIDVNLLVYRGHNVVNDSSFTMKTNDRGKFTFTSLKIDSTLIYYPRAAFNSIVYYGRAARLTGELNSVASDVVVYDTTSRADKIVFQLEHLFIDAEPGNLYFREIFIANNMGNKTFIGSNFDQHNEHYVLQFPLPKGFEDVEILTPEARNWVRIEGQTLFHTELMSPGSRQFSYRFIVPFKKKQWLLSRPILYPLGAVNIFVSNPELVLEGSGVMAMGDFAIRGTNYQRYAVQHLMPGMELVLSVKNLPVKAFVLSAQWIVLLAVIVLLIIGFGYTLKKSKS